MHEEHAQGLTFVSLPAKAIDGIKFDVFNHALAIHRCLHRADCDCQPDLHLAMHKRYGRQSSCGVHVGHMQEGIAHSSEISICDIRYVISGAHEE